MKHILKLCCGMMALLSAAACNNDEWEQTTGLLPSTDNDNKVCITAYAAGNNANTRVEYSAEGNTFSLAWEDEESFSIMRGEENKTFSKNTEGNNFTGTMPTAGTGNFYAFYPVTTATNPTAVALDLTTQTGALNSNCTYMRASSADGELFEFIVHR